MCCYHLSVLLLILFYFRYFLLELTSQFFFPFSSLYFSSTFFFFIVFLLFSFTSSLPSDFDLFLFFSFPLYLICLSFLFIINSFSFSSFSLLFQWFSLLFIFLSLFDFFIPFFHYGTSHPSNTHLCLLIANSSFLGYGEFPHFLFYLILSLSFRHGHVLPRISSELRFPCKCGCEVRELLCRPTDYTVYMFLCMWVQSHSDLLVWMEIYSGSGLREWFLDG